MSGLSSVGSIALAYATVAVSPGTNFLVVSRFALGGHRDEACLAALGVAAGASLLAGAVFTGSQWLSSLPPLLAAMQVVFAATLVTLGTSALWRACQKPRPEPKATKPVSRPSFIAGLLTALTNPITVGFFVGLAADQRTSAETHQVLTVSCVIFTVAALWFCPVALLLSHPRLRLVFERRAAFDAAAGCLLIVLGVTAGSRLVA